MDPVLPDFEKLYLEAEEKRLIAERKLQKIIRERLKAEREHQKAKCERLEAERATKDERSRHENADREKESVVAKLRKTTLPEFLNACHVHLHCNLSVQTDSNF